MPKPTIQQPTVVSVHTLLSSKEVAEMLAISDTALTQLRYRGGGPDYLQFGRQIRYRPADVVAYIESALVMTDGAHRMRRGQRKAS